MKGSPPKPIEELTPEARAERATRLIAEGVKKLVEATLARGAAETEWVNQAHSPLGRRRHIVLARKGIIPSKKIGRDILVRRSDLDAYIQREGLSRGVPLDDEPLDEIVRKLTDGTKSHG